MRSLTPYPRDIDSTPHMRRDSAHHLVRDLARFGVGRTPYEALFAHHMRRGVCFASAPAVRRYPLRGKLSLQLTFGGVMLNAHDHGEPWALLGPAAVPPCLLIEDCAVMIDGEPEQRWTWPGENMDEAA